jgi:cob(I)alamin adenosyltransferase
MPESIRKTAPAVIQLHGGVTEANSHIGYAAGGCQGKKLIAHIIKQHGFLH